MPIHPDGGAALVLARALSLSSLMSLAGAAGFRAVVAPGILAAMSGFDRAWRRLVLASTAAGLAGLAAWLILQSADLADAPGLAGAVAVLPAVLAHTRFGHICLLQAACLLAAAGLVLARYRASPPVILAIGLATLALHALRTHAAVMGDAWLYASELVHITAGALWLGGLLPLLLTLHLAPLAAAHAAASRFGRLGIACVVLLLATAAFQFWQLAGSLAGLVGTPYGWVMLGKAAAFAALLACAALNRFRLVPALPANPQAARGALVLTIAIETAWAMVILLLAALLAQLTPSMHMQPNWPFAWRLSLDTVNEDPDFRAEVLRAAAALMLALLLGLLAVFAASWLSRVARLAALALAIAIAGMAVPHLSLLLVPANPDSFFHSPSGFTAASILRGQALYPANCAACHGSAGRGDGPAAAGLPVPPADLTAPHLWGHSDGQLFWWLSHGIVAPGGRSAMPGFARSLTDDERWALIDFIRARNAGAAIQQAAQWPVPVQAPEIPLACRDTAASLADLRGTIVRFVASPAQPAATPGLRTIWVDPAARPSHGICAATDPSAAAAYAVIAGSPAPGLQVLIDAAGRLARLQRPGPGPGWNDPAALALALKDLAAHPIPASQDGPAMPGMAM